MDDCYKPKFNHPLAKHVEDYHALYQQSVNDPQQFWHAQAQKYISWLTPWHSVQTGNFTTGRVDWFPGATLNVCYNCLDRHLPDYADNIALLWEADKPGKSRQLTYQQLFDDVCRFANVLKKLGVTKGDCVCIYMPLIPEAVMAMLACARIGAIHSVVFAGFSAQSLKSRILDARCKVVITADASKRGGRIIPLKANVDEIIARCPCVKHVLVVENTGLDINYQVPRDIHYQTMSQHVEKECPIEPVLSTDPLFVLYTSGSTGQPKGIKHSSGGYLLYATMTYQWIFAYQQGDIHWCTADIGWITGHSYVVYGPLASAGTTLIYEGVPLYPTASRLWEIIDRYQVNSFYTAPTAIRALMCIGDAPVKATSRQSLKVLGSVGEPINPEAWRWYYNVVGEQRCPIVDTWWQTETGGIMLSPIPGITPLKPGSTAWPFFGIKPALVNQAGEKVMQQEHGDLIIEQPWPGQLQTVLGNDQRYIDTYLSPVLGSYFTGDGACCDEEGYYWITGRIDDVLNVAGHRLGTAEIESALVSHSAIAEAAVVAFPHDIRGEGIYAFVMPMANIRPTEALKKELLQQVSKEISAIAKPDIIQWVSELPKTRSGKIMRRLLRKIVLGETNALGDVTTLSNSTILDTLLSNVDRSWDNNRS